MHRWTAVRTKKQALLLLGLAAAAFLIGAPVLRIAFSLLPLALFAGAIYLSFRLGIGPLSRVIARIRVGVLWKILAALVLMALPFLVVSLINGVAMDYMHDQLHRIQALRASDPQLAREALDALERAQHGLLFSGTLFLGFLAALVALGLGLAIVASVTEPVRRMGQAMRRLAGGDFSQPVQVANRDELGDLAERINSTAQELARLQQAIRADERARALQERIAQVTLAQEEERRRISRELHDGLGPSLAAIGNRLRACQQLLRTDPQGAERELEEIAKTVKGYVQEIRELIHELRPLALDQLGLSEALRQQLERFGQEARLQATLWMPKELALDPLAEVTVFRVIQECLSNVAKHAAASQVQVILQELEAGLEVRVQDDGRGFDLQSASSNGLRRGLGLLSMQERAELLGGTLSVRSSPDAGCQVVLRIPSREVHRGAHPHPVG